MRAKKNRKFTKKRPLNRPADYLVIVFVALVGAYALYHSFAQSDFNTVQLDDGTCGNDLQLGSGTTYSSVSTPTFIITGDGGASSYSVEIDGTSIGTFRQTGNVRAPNVCVTDPTPLSNGNHTLTGQELAPKPPNSLTPFSFTVDTTPPPAPSQPVLEPYSDTGGDDITTDTSLSFGGTSAPDTSVFIYIDGKLNGGAVSDGNGNWLAATTPVSDGQHTVIARSFSLAGILSVSSPSLTIYVGTPPVGYVLPASPSSTPNNPTPTAPVPASTPHKVPVTTSKNAASTPNGGSTPPANTTNSSAPTSNVSSPSPSNNVTNTPQDNAINNSVALAPVKQPSQIKLSNADSRYIIVGIPLALIVVVGLFLLNLLGVVNINPLLDRLRTWRNRLRSKKK